MIIVLFDTIQGTGSILAASLYSFQTLIKSTFSVEPRQSFSSDLKVLAIGKSLVLN